MKKLMIVALSMCFNLDAERQVAGEAQANTNEPENSTDKTALKDPEDTTSKSKTEEEIDEETTETQVTDEDQKTEKQPIEEPSL